VDRFGLLVYVWHPAAYEFAVYKRGSLARSIGVYADACSMASNRLTCR
jgi:hypothetical protein